jgi:4-hydroxybutyrate CoA-transferase
LHPGRFVAHHFAAMVYPEWKSRAVSAAEVVAHLKSHHRVFVHGAAATPTTLLDALCQRTDLEGVRLYHLHLNGPCNFTAPEHAGRFIPQSLFTGPSLRKPVEEARADFIPIFLSDIPRLFKSKRVPLDVAIVQLSPPDNHGLCTLGPSVDTALAAVENADIVLAEINERMPRTIGAPSCPSAA